MKKKYIIKRTGRRCTRYPVKLEDGTVRTLNATGTHVWELTEGEAARIGKLKDTRITAIDKPAAPPAEPAQKAKAPKKAKAKK